MINEQFEKLFQMPRRKPESNITRFYMDVAASVQKVTEEIVVRLAKSAAEYTGHEENLVLAGGIALNCVANGKLLREKIFKNIWIQPAAGDAGGSVGAAYLGYYQYLKGEILDSQNSKRFSTYLGPEYGNREIEQFLRGKGVKYHCIKANKAEVVAGLLCDNQIVGLFQGRMEFGPRALGNRSIIAGSQSADMQSKINLKIKFRESFRPFAPAVLADRASEYFDLETESPYMLLCTQVKKKLCYRFNITDVLDENEDIIAVSRIPRSAVSAVTHVDFSARIQTVNREENKIFYEIIEEYSKKSGCPVIVNTSFNVRSEPIVCTLEDAYLCFMRTEMDALCIGDFILYKSEQNVQEVDMTWKEMYQLD